MKLLRVLVLVASGLPALAHAAPPPADMEAERVKAEAFTASMEAKGQVNRAQPFLWLAQPSGEVV